MTISVQPRRPPLRHKIHVNIKSKPADATVAWAALPIVVSNLRVSAFPTTLEVLLEERSLQLDGPPAARRSVTGRRRRRDEDSGSGRLGGGLAVTRSFLFRLGSSLAQRFMLSPPAVQSHLLPMHLACQVQTFVIHFFLVRSRVLIPFPPYT